jgi:hypothetical protein
MRFIVMAAPIAVATAAHTEAVVLLPGQALPWPTLRDNSTFVIPLVRG